MDASAAAPEVSLPPSDSSSEYYVTASEHSESTESSENQSHSSLEPSKVSTDEMAKVSAELEELTTSLAGTDEAVYLRAVDDRPVKDTNLVGEGADSHTHTNAAKDRQDPMIANIFKLLDRINANAGFVTAMDDMAKILAQDEDMAAALSLCTMCLKPGENFCGGCEQARYCSAECQRADWPIHKKLCKAFKASDGPRPSPSHRRALYLSFETNKMDLIWIECNESPEGMENMVDIREPIKRESIRHDDLDKFIKLTMITGESEPPRYTYLSLTPALARRRIPHALVAYHMLPEKSEGLFHPTLINHTINAFADPGYLLVHFGPIVVFACDPGTGVKGSCRAVKDVTPRDVRHTIDAFTVSHHNPCIPDADRYHAIVQHGKQMCGEQKTGESKPVNKEDGEKSAGGDTAVDNSPGDNNSEGINLTTEAAKPKKKKKKSAPKKIVPRATAPLTISAIKISDIKERYNIAMGVTHPIELVTIPVYVPGLASSASTMAFRLGLSWYVRQTSDMSRQTNPRSFDPKTAEYQTRWYTGDLRWLGSTTDLSPSGKRHYHLAADQHVGSVVVFHGKGAPLDPLHIAAFNNYLDSVYISKGVPTAEGLEAFWKDMKNDAKKLGIPATIQRLASPGNLEEKYAAERDWACTYSSRKENIIEAAKNDEVWVEIVKDVGKLNQAITHGFAVIANEQKMKGKK